MTASRFWTLTDSEWTVRAVNGNPKTGGGGAGGGGGGGPTKRPGGGWGKGGKPGGGGGDPFASDVVFLTNFDGTHGGTDAVDEGPFGKALVFNGNAMLSNAQVYSEDYGTALDLDGNGDFVTVGTFDEVFDPAAAPWTFDARVRPDTEAVSGGIVIFNLVGGQGQMALVADPRSSARNISYSDRRGGSFANRISVTNQFFVNEWIEIALSFDGDVLTLYKNGTVIGTNNPAVNTLNDFSASSLGLGPLVSGLGFDFAGQMQAVRFTLADRYGGASYTPEGRWAL